MKTQQAPKHPPRKRWFSIGKRVYLVETGVLAPQCFGGSKSPAISSPLPSTGRVHTMEFVPEGTEISCGDGFMSLMIGPSSVLAREVVGVGSVHSGSHVVTATARQHGCDIGTAEIPQAQMWEGDTVSKQSRADTFAKKMPRPNQILTRSAGRSPSAEIQLRAF